MRDSNLIHRREALLLLAAGAGALEWDMGGASAAAPFVTNDVAELRRVLM